VENTDLDLPEACRVSSSPNLSSNTAWEAASSVQEVTESLAASAGMQASFGVSAGSFAAPMQSTAAVGMNISTPSATPISNTDRWY
jgi:hypothetical protein